MSPIMRLFVALLLYLYISPLMSYKERICGAYNPVQLTHARVRAYAYAPARVGESDALVTVLGTCHICVYLKKCVIFCENVCVLACDRASYLNF